MARLAGSGAKGFRDGPALQAELHGPTGAAVAPDGSIYFSDAKDNRIRVLKDGIVRTVAGSGVQGILDGPALSAKLDWPSDLTEFSISQIIKIIESES